MIIWSTEDTTFIATITTSFLHKSLGWPWWLLPSIMIITSLTRFNHENVIDIRDILRSASLDSMKDVYIVQVIMTLLSPYQRPKPLSYKNAFSVFSANTFLLEVAFSVPDGDRSVQAAQNPAVKQRSHLLLSLPGVLCIMVMMAIHMIPCCAITHSKCWLDRCCSVYKKEDSKTNTKRCNSCNFWSEKMFQIWLDLLAVQILFPRKPSGRYISCEAGWISTINFFSLRPNKFFKLGQE